MRIIEETPLPPEIDLDELRQCVRSAAVGSPHEGEIAGNIYFCDTETIRRLNNRYREIDSATDVLSFPLESSAEFATPPDLPHELGDVFVCVPLAVEQATTYGHSVMRELTFLAVHGTLHLLGFDHESDSERTRMRTEEEKVLAAIRR